VIAELFIINSVITVVVLLVLLCSLIFVDKFQNEPILFFITFITVGTAPLGMNWLYSGLEQYGYITKRSILFKTISLLLVFALVHDKSDYGIYAGVMAFSTIGSYLFNFFYARRFFSIKLIHKLRFKIHFKPTLYLFGSILAVSIYTNLDTIMLGFVSGDTQVGLYTVATKVKWLLLTSVNAISTVLLPRLSYYISENRIKEFKAILKKSTSIILMISIPLTLFFISEAKDTIMILGGNDYIKAAISMQIIMPILLISGFSNITGNQILIPLGKDKLFLIAVSLGAVVNFIINLILLKPYGSVGASIATLIAEVAQMLIQLWFSRSYIKNSVDKRGGVRIIVGSLVALSVSLFIKLFIYSSNNAFINIIIQGIIFFGIYLLFLLLIKEPLLYEYGKFDVIFKKKNK
jgi:O-antigen/teichoic acid export membrane protein